MGEFRRTLLVTLASIAITAAVIVGTVFVAGSFRPTMSRSCGDGPTIRWFVGLGTGTQPSQIDTEKKAVEDYNRDFACRRPQVKLEIIPSSNALDTLKSEMAAGFPPDIVGPLGVGLLARLDGLLADLRTYTSKPIWDKGSPTVDPGLQDRLGSLLSDRQGHTVGLPYLVYPAFMFYDKDLFAKAGLADLPTKVGQTYMGKTWDWNEVKALGLRLTADTLGRHPGEPGFDAKHISTWGFDFQWWDARRVGSAFGGGGLYGVDGTARIPSAWSEGWSWYRDAIWTNHIAPDLSAIKSDALRAGAAASGRVAMAVTNTWAISTFGNLDKPAFKHWGIAVLPSWQGQTAAPLDLETFAVMKSSKPAAEAFQAMLAIESNPDLMAAYEANGAMPAATSARQAYFDRMDAVIAKDFPDNPIDWTVLTEMLDHPAIPSHEAWMPNYDKAAADVGQFYDDLRSKPALDLTARERSLKWILQCEFNASVPAAASCADQSPPPGWS